jgi:hypothetical protein
MIKIIDFSNVEIDGKNVGDCIAASANHPNLASDILTALIAYDNSRAASVESVPIGDPRVPELEAELAAERQKRSELEAQLSRYAIGDWPGLIDALSDAGLDEMLLSIATAARNTPNPTGRRLEAEYIRLQTNLDLSAREGNTQAVKNAYGALLQFAGELMGLNPPISPELIADISAAIPALQQVLVDRGIPTTLMEFVVPSFG